MLGFIFSAIAGAAMSFQGVINTRLNEKIGLYEANAFVQGTAFLFAMMAVGIAGDGNFKEILNIPKLYWTGGLIGIVITITVMLSISHLSPTIAISTILITQLLVAAAIDAFGLLGAQKITFDWTKYAGLVIMIAGIIIFKSKS